MYYYGSFEGNINGGTRYVRAYDEQVHGEPRIMSDHWTFLYHNTLIVNSVYKTEAEAMEAAWGKYSTTPVILPNGEETSPAEYFNNSESKARDPLYIAWKQRMFEMDAWLSKGDIVPAMPKRGNAR